MHIDKAREREFEYAKDRNRGGKNKAVSHKRDNGNIQIDGTKTHC